MRWPWRQQGAIAPRRAAVSIRALELETAKEILIVLFAFYECMNSFHG